MVRRRRGEGAAGSEAEGLPRGATVAGYRIRRALDQPNSSYVAYEATKGARGPGVVFKLIDERLSADERFSSHLSDELHRQSAITHPAMLPVLDGGRATEGLFVVTALVRRPTLADALRAESRDFEYAGLEPPRAMKLLGQVAEVLEEAHAVDLVHGCLQMGCIRLGADGEALVDDFGLGRLEAGVDPYVGRPVLYGAPEQFAGEPATPRSDVYGLAAIAYECLTGAAPYWHGALSHDGKPPLGMARHSRDLPGELDEPFARALSEAPRERQATVTELTQELHEALASWSSVAPASGSDASPVPSPGGTRGARRGAERRDPIGVTVWNEGDAAPARPARVAAGKDGGDEHGGEPGSKRLRLIATTTALAVAAATAAGVAIAGRDGDAPPPKAPGPVRAGPVELTAQQGWQRADRVGLPGVTFAEPPIALAASGTGGPTLVAGTVAAEGPTFVPQPIVATLGEGLPRPDLVTLRDVRALRYSGLRPRGLEAVMTLYTVPTPAGAVVVSCSVPATDSSVAQLERCERVAGTLSIRGAQSQELIFSAEYGQVLTGVVTRLNAVRSRERENLRRRGRQPEAARSLALAYAAAGRTLAEADPPPNAELHASIRRAFRRTRQAYAGLSAAARRNDRAAYLRSRQAVNDGEAEIQASLQALNTLGYTAG